MALKHLIAVGAVAGLVTCGGRGDGDAALDCTQPRRAETVELADFEFRPSCLEAVEGETIGLENTGEAPHTFTVEGTDVDVDLEAGTSGDVTISDVEPGDHRLVCTYHPQMTGTVTIS